MHVAGIALDAASRSPIVLLRDPSGRRQVPIWIDQAQAHNIMAGIQDEPPPRPLSHDLMVALLEAGGLSLERVIIHAIEENTFRAVLKLGVSGAGSEPSGDATEGEGESVMKDADQAEAQSRPDDESVQNTAKIQEVDARPSDAIALAIRTGSGIWMLEEVVAEASIPVDAEADSEEQDAFRRFLDQVSPAALVRHLESRQPEEGSGADPAAEG
ncbi:bifunctional nuclease family protein [Synechococcus sp. HK01-R]|uniref:bifunctional nuclease family protein n=1 Tax=Synechococcus sp. HK01-R TaxID=2751171 RepID=UPI001623C2BD|nr:bifunctional nuclease family protein [Synechococcus sp. HK01-R]QNG26000.1 bifunctional nuclease family protein [Synechococcus sp. HK01-R]